MVYLKNQDTLFDMLKSLKARLAPTDEARTQEVVDKYSKLKNVYSKRTNMETWLKDWEITYSDAVALDLPETTKLRSHIDFARAISGWDEAYSTTLVYDIESTSRRDPSGNSLPTVYDIIDRFRNHYRMQVVLNKQPSHSAFPTLKKNSRQ